MFQKQYDILSFHPVFDVAWICLFYMPMSSYGTTSFISRVVMYELLQVEFWNYSSVTLKPLHFREKWHHLRKKKGYNTELNIQINIQREALLEHVPSLNLGSSHSSEKSAENIRNL